MGAGCLQVSGGMRAIPTYVHMHAHAHTHMYTYIEIANGHRHGDIHVYHV